MAKDALDARAFPPDHAHADSTARSRAGIIPQRQRKPHGLERYYHDLAYRASVSKTSNNLDLLCDALMVPADALTGYISWLRDKHAAGAPLRRLIRENLARYRKEKANALQQLPN